MGIFINRLSCILAQKQVLFSVTCENLTHERESADLRYLKIIVEAWKEHSFSNVYTKLVKIAYIAWLENKTAIQ
jgi:hypothetical protein